MSAAAATTKDDDAQLQSIPLMIRSRNRRKELPLASCFAVSIAFALLCGQPLLLATAVVV